MKFELYMTSIDQESSLRRRSAGRPSSRPGSKTGPKKGAAPPRWADGGWDTDWRDWERWEEWNGNWPAEAWGNDWDDWSDWGDWVNDPLFAPKQGDRRPSPRPRKPRSLANPASPILKRLMIRKETAGYLCYDPLTCKIFKLDDEAGDLLIRLQQADEGEKATHSEDRDPKQVEEFLAFLRHHDIRR